MTNFTPTPRPIRYTAYVSCVVALLVAAGAAVYLISEGAFL